MYLTTETVTKLIVTFHTLAVLPELKEQICWQSHKRHTSINHYIVLQMHTFQQVEKYILKESGKKYNFKTVPQRALKTKHNWKNSLIFLYTVTRQE